MKNYEINIDKTILEMEVILFIIWVEMKLKLLIVVFQQKYKIELFFIKINFIKNNEERK